MPTNTLYATIHLDDELVMEVTSGDMKSAVVMSLNRISAQQLGDALLEYAGAVSKSVRRGRTTMIGGHDLTVRAGPERRPIVRVGMRRR
jgi:hypothetical protein